MQHQFKVRAVCNSDPFFSNALYESREVKNGSLTTYSVVVVRLVSWWDTQLCWIAQPPDQRHGWPAQPPDPRHGWPAQPPDDESSPSASPPHDRPLRSRTPPSSFWIRSGSFYLQENQRSHPTRAWNSEIQKSLFQMQGGIRITKDEKLWQDHTQQIQKRKKITLLSVYWLSQSFWYHMSQRHVPQTFAIRHIWQILWTH